MVASEGAVSAAGEQVRAKWASQAKDAPAKIKLCFVLPCHHMKAGAFTSSLTLTAFLMPKCLGQLLLICLGIEFFHFP